MANGADLALPGKQSTVLGLNGPLAWVELSSVIPHPLHRVLLTSGASGTSNQRPITTIRC